MAYTWKTFGHESIKRILSAQLAAQKFPHAYLFLGPDGVGKHHLAKEFASYILEAETLHNHPDFHVLDSEGEITVEAVRGFIAQAHFKPFVAGKKVALLNNAQRLNVQSANALLKTLEEAGENTIVILVASEQPLPTIVSRCQVLRFNAFSFNQLQTFATTQGLEVNDALLGASCGSISQLKKNLENIQHGGTMVRQLEALSELRNASTAERVAQINTYAELETSELEHLFISWLYLEKKKIVQDTSRRKVLTAIGKALLDCKTNKNKKLILQGLFLGM